MTKLKVYENKQHRTCLLIEERSSTAVIIPLDMKKGIHILEININEWKSEYSPNTTHTVEKVAKLFKNFSHSIGATDGALDMLAIHCQITDRDREIAKAKLRGDTLDHVVDPPEAGSKKASSKRKSTAQKPVAKAKPATKKVSQKPVEKPKPTAKKVAPASKKPATRSKPSATGGSKPSKPDGEYRSASAMFKGLILEGKHSDDKIFELVQKKFGLDDSKKSYVAWNRRDLIKKGLLKEG